MTNYQKCLLLLDLCHISLFFNNTHTHFNSNILIQLIDFSFKYANLIRWSHICIKNTFKKIPIQKYTCKNISNQLLKIDCDIYSCKELLIHF